MEVFLCLVLISVHLSTALVSKYKVFHQKRMEFSRDLVLGGSKEDLVASVGSSAAKKAGDVILEGSKAFKLDTGVISKIGSRDILTEYDTKCQEVVKETILAAFPGHEFLGEEDIPPGRDAGE